MKALRSPLLDEPWDDGRKTTSHHLNVLYNPFSMWTPRGQKLPSVIAVAASALLGGIVACAGLLAYQHHRLGEPVGRSAAIQSVLLARAPLLTVEPWSDPVAHREKGCVILIGNTAWTESTQAGGTKVYVLTPVEEVRRNLESLRQITRQSTSKRP